jgi:hypothetical protein
MSLQLETPPDPDRTSSGVTPETKNAPVTDVKMDEGPAAQSELEIACTIITQGRRGIRIAARSTMNQSQRQAVAKPAAQTFVDATARGRPSRDAVATESKADHRPLLEEIDHLTICRRALISD